MTDINQHLEQVIQPLILTNPPHIIPFMSSYGLDRTECSAHRFTLGCPRCPFGKVTMRFDKPGLWAFRCDRCQLFRQKVYRNLVGLLQLHKMHMNPLAILAELDDYVRRRRPLQDSGILIPGGPHKGKDATFVPLLDLAQCLETATFLTPNLERRIHRHLEENSIPAPSPIREKSAILAF